jgi:hypothetical protein
MKKAQERPSTNVSDMEAAIRECEDARDTLLGAVDRFRGPTGNKKADQAIQMARKATDEAEAARDLFLEAVESLTGKRPYYTKLGR